MAFSSPESPATGLSRWGASAATSNNASSVSNEDDRFTVPEITGFRGCDMLGFVTGHDFSRAAKQQNEAGL